MRVRAAQATTIVLFALVMGVFWGTWFALARTMDTLPGDTFVRVGQEMIQNLARPMSILLPVALVSSLVTMALLRSGRWTPALTWQLVGFLLMVAALLVTLTVNVPIDNKIKTWTGTTLPGDWRSLQARWETFHTLRTFLSIGAVIAVTISAVTAHLPTRIRDRALARTAAAR